MNRQSHAFKCDLGKVRADRAVAVGIVRNASRKSEAGLGRVGSGLERVALGWSGRGRLDQFWAWEEWVGWKSDGWIGCCGDVAPGING